MDKHELKTQMEEAVHTGHYSSDLFKSLLDYMRDNISLENMKRDLPLWSFLPNLGREVVHIRERMATGYYPIESPYSAEADTKLIEEIKKAKSHPYGDFLTNNINWGISCVQREREEAHRLQKRCEEVAKDIALAEKTGQYTVEHIKAVEKIMREMDIDSINKYFNVAEFLQHIGTETAAAQDRLLQSSESPQHYNSNDAYFIISSDWLWYGAIDHASFISDNINIGKAQYVLGQEWDKKTLSQEEIAAELKIARQDLSAPISIDSLRRVESLMNALGIEELQKQMNIDSYWTKVGNEFAKLSIHAALPSENGLEAFHLNRLQIAMKAYLSLPQYQAYFAQTAMRGYNEALESYQRLALQSERVVHDVTGKLVRQSALDNAIRNVGHITPNTRGDKVESTIQEMLNVMKIYPLNEVKKRMNVEAFWRDVGVEMYRCEGGTAPHITFDERHKDIDFIKECIQQGFEQAREEYRRVNPLTLTPDQATHLTYSQRHSVTHESIGEPVAYKAVSDYKEHFKSILLDLEYQPYITNKDFETGAIGTPLNYDLKVIADMRCVFQQDNEQIAELDKMEREAYEEVKDTIEQRACSANSRTTRQFLAEFSEKHNLNLPIQEWNHAAMMAELQQAQTLIDLSKGDPYAVVQATQPISQIMYDFEQDAVEHVDIKGFWQEVGRQTALLEKEQLLSMPTPQPIDNSNLVKCLMEDSTWSQYGDFIRANIQTGRTEILSQESPELWAQIVEMKTKDAGGYATENLSDVMQLINNVPLDVVTAHIQLENFFQDCYDLAYEINSADSPCTYEEARFLRDLTQAIQNPKVLDCISSQTQAGIICSLELDTRLRGDTRQQEELTYDTPTIGDLW